MITKQEEKNSRDDMVETLVSNLSALRAKLGITQNDLADSIGVGRQTLLTIENKRGKMRWDTFLATSIVFSTCEATCDYMRFLGIHLDSLEKLVRNEILSKKGGNLMKYEKLWTDYESECNMARAICPLPDGLKGSTCPKCGGNDLTGALITPNADEQDPNILCKDCGYWRS